MDRLACVDVAAFPLQLLLRDHPDWAARPVVVVESERPQALVLFVNGRARRLGVRSGQRYATALTLVRDLHAGAVAPSRVEEGVRALADRLRRFSPHVEPSKEIPGVFWLDASGLHHVYPSLTAWAASLRSDLQSAGMDTSVAVGFTRFGVYALAISHPGVTVVHDGDEEQARVCRVPLTRLNLEPDVRDQLLALGIDTLGRFLQLPAEEIRPRFGAAMERLYRLAAGTRHEPLVPAPAPIRHRETTYFDVPESSTDRLLFAIKQLLDGMLPVVRKLDRAVIEVVLHMTFDTRDTRIESIKPAAATLDVSQLLTLIRLRLETLPLSNGADADGRVSRGVVTLLVAVETCQSGRDQRELLPEQSRRDTEAANRALARLRAECGEQSVVRASIRDAHLPSARFAWEPITHVAATAAPRPVDRRPLVRRILTKPVPLPEAWRTEQDAEAAAVASSDVAADGITTGPYRISGGWWGSGSGARREYYFVRTTKGETWWVYFDHRRHQFFLQGKVE